MCSILTMVSNNKLPKDLLIKAPELLNKTAHRGPDDSSFFILDDKIYLGSNRLSIIGLTDEGRMPLKAHNRDCWIVFNGEIYNYKELRSELQSNGFIFKSSTDTEVVLNAYLFWGEEFVSKLNGMFAFFIFDKEKNRAISARDRFGIKPLYYAYHENSIVYSSDFLLLKNLCYPNNIEINHSALTAYINCRFVPGKTTILKNIYKLEPGEIQFTNLDSLAQKSRKYWKPTFQLRKFKQEDFNEYLDKAIHYTFQADVEPSLLLSGGLDSSAIAAILHRQGHRDIKNFTCAFSNSYKTKDSNKSFNSITTPNIDEREFAHLISDKLGFNLENSIIDPNFPKGTFLEMQTALSEPIASPNALGLFLFSKKLKGKTKASITGTGSDELLGGYQQLYFGDKHSDFSSQDPLSILNSFVDFDNGKNKPISYLNPEFVETDYLHECLEDSMSNIPKEKYPKELLNQIMSFELGFALPGWELDQADRLFMSQSIELRPAFLENSFVDYCLSIPSADKYDKKPLKTAMQGYLPDTILKRPKYPGLGTPMDICNQKWFKELKEDLIADPLDIWNTSQIKKLSNGDLSNVSFDVLYRLIYMQSWIKNIASVN